MNNIQDFFLAVIALIVVVTAVFNIALDNEDEPEEMSLIEYYSLKTKGEDSPHIPMSEPVQDERIAINACKSDPECAKLSEALVFEARSESIEGQIAVASVILNRVEHKNFPDTIWGVVTQPYQFSYVGFEHLQQQPSEQDWEKSSIVAYNIKHGLVERLDGVYFYLNKQALGYKLPRWAIEYTEAETIGVHTFYTW